MTLMDDARTGSTSVKPSGLRPPRNRSNASDRRKPHSSSRTPRHRRVSTDPFRPPTLHRPARRRRQSNCHSLRVTNLAGQHTEPTIQKCREGRADTSTRDRVLRARPERRRYGTPASHSEGQPRSSSQHPQQSSAASRTARPSCNARGCRRGAGCPTWWAEKRQWPNGLAARHGCFRVIRIRFGSVILASLP